METTQNNPGVNGTEIKKEISNFLDDDHKYQNLNTEREKRIFEAGFRHGIDYYHNQNTHGSVI